MLKSNAVERSDQVRDGEISMPFCSLYDVTLLIPRMSYLDLGFELCQFVKFFFAAKEFTKILQGI